MTPRSEYRTGDIVNKPGVYVFRDRLHAVIYVGKAKSLRKRLSSYFQPSRAKAADPKLRSLINSIAFYEIFPVRTEQEAILLESRFIKQHSPRYNVVLRDDKRFLLIRIDLANPYPYLSLARLRKDDGCAYYGPFPHAGVLRNTLDYLTRHFGLRSCKPRIPDEADHKHCLDHIVRFCSAPCIAAISEADYRERIEQLLDVLDGKTGGLLVAIEEEMRRHAGRQQFEKAAELRDIHDNVSTVFGSRHRNFRHANMTRYPGAEAVSDLHDALELEAAPKAIECFDISNISGQFAVASMVRFFDGTPEKKAYRHFRIKTVSGIDDFAMMREAVGRRYRRLLKEERPLPDLVVIDGGMGQLNAAYAALEELELESLPIIGLAKKHEEIHTLNGEEPIQLERHEPALRLLQAIRDEAHRFAITFHKSLRRKRILDSLLDEIPGVGKKRKQELLKAFGSVRNLRRHDALEVQKRVPGIGQELAMTIVDHLKRTRQS